MTKKIEKLTPEQEALMPVYVDRFIKVGHSTHTDRTKAEEAVNLAYECAGLTPPKQFIWFDSPFSQALGYAALKDKGDSMEDSVMRSVWRSVGDSVWASVWASVRASVGDSVVDSVRVFVEDSVDDSVWDSVGDSVWASVRDSVGDSVVASVWAWYKSNIEGTHLSHWAAWWAYWTEVVGLDLPMGRGLAATLQECGWLWPGREVCLMSPKPSVCKVHKNSQGRFVLHDEGEPALCYEDGFAIWAYDGHRLLNEKYHCHPNQWQAQWILEEDNADTRTALLKGIGYDRFVGELGGDVVDTWALTDGLGQEHPYELIKMPPLGFGPEMKFLKMKNPSVPGMMHVEPVAPFSWINTAQKALLWREFGDEAENMAVEAVEHLFVK